MNFDCLTLGAVVSFQVPEARRCNHRRKDLLDDGRRALVEEPASVPVAAAAVERHRTRVDGKNEKFSSVSSLGHQRRRQGT